MKRILIFSLVLFGLMSNKSNAQSKQPVKQFVKYHKNVDTPFTNKEKQFIVEAYSQTFFNSLKNNKGLEIRFKNILRNRTEIYYVESEEKLKNFPLLSSIGLFKAYNPNIQEIPFNKKTFNVLKYNFNFDSNQSYRVRIDNTNNLLIIRSQFN